MRCLKIAYENPSEVQPEDLVLERVTGHTVYGTSTTEFCVHFMFPLRYMARPP